MPESIMNSKNASTSFSLGEVVAVYELVRESSADCIAELCALVDVGFGAMA